MNNEHSTEKIDIILDLLSKPLSRYILSVLAGVYPGVFEGLIGSQGDDSDNEVD